MKIHGSEKLKNENFKNLENIENIKYLENIENIKYLENIENIKYLENIENSDNTKIQRIIKKVI